MKTLHTGPKIFDDIIAFIAFAVYQGAFSINVTIKEYRLSNAEALAAG